MDKFMARQNVEHYRKLLETSTDEAQREMIRGLLAEEEAKLKGWEQRAAIARARKRSDVTAPEN